MACWVAATLNISAQIAATNGVSHPPTYQLPEILVAAPAATETETTARNLTSENLERHQVRTVREILPLLPNAAVSQGESSHAAYFSVRGSREVPWHELTSGRSGVGFYVDDIPALDAYSRDWSLLDVENTDFYSAPHGTAFGVPHSMGLLNITSRAPGPQWRSGGSYQFGTYRLHEFRANGSGPIRSNLFFGISGLWGQRDGYFKNQTTGDSFGDRLTLSGQAKLRWQPNDEFTADLTAGIARHDDDPLVYVNGTTPADRFVAADHPGSFSKRDQHYQAARLQWQAEAWQLKSITTHQQGRYRDQDPTLLIEIFAPFSIARLRDQHSTAWAQEFRAESADPERDWRWCTGLFLGWRDYSFIHTNVGLGPDEGRHDIRSRTQDYALYGELTRAVGEHLELSAGLRLQTTLDHSWAQFQPTPFAAGLGAVPASTDDRADFTGALPMLGARWQWSTNQNTHLRLSSGLQPGGLRLPATGSTDYDSQKSWHAELGQDATFWNGRFTVNATAFYSEYRDYQSFQFYPGARNIFTAARAHAFGGELEGRLQLRPGLAAYATAGYTEARYDDFTAVSGNFSGNRINNIPITTVALGLETRAAWGGCANVDWTYTGKYFFDEGNTTKQSGYSLLNLRVGWESETGSVFAFAKNVLDRGYYSAGYLFGGALAAVPGDPLTLGVECQFRF